MSSLCASASIGLTLQIILWATVLQLILGTLLGWLLAHKCFPGKGMLDVLIMLPLIFPPMVLGYGLLMALGQRGWLLAWLSPGLRPDIIFQMPGLVIAAFIAGLPLMVKPVQTAFQAIHRDMQEAGATLGARPWAVFTQIEWPLARHGVITGLILSCGRALGEVGISLMLGGNIVGRTETLSLAIYNHVMDGQFDCANQLSLLLCGLSALIFFLLKRYGSL
ncbi:MAG: molybdate ABC transporter permease subunit [Castellaniella sp.]|uniref:molybdate ABC transporter permease subunit n=1 Tax=Castellaniella sp. TaxID=1955812 RepID=UPI003A8B01A9